MQAIENGLARVRAVLERRRPSYPVYAPNYWQWLAHQRNHGRLPPELAGRRSQLEMIRHLGLDVFSRNLYCDQKRRWFGGLADEVFDGVECRVEETIEGADLVRVITYATRRGALTERLRYVFAESTLVQEKFLLDDPDRQLDAFEEWVRARRWQFFPERYRQVQDDVGTDGLVVAGELFSPLKLLHLAAGAVNTTFLLQDHGKRLRGIMAEHEQAMLGLTAQIVGAGVPVLMAMDNLDTAFHPPRYVENYSARFYEQASRICHEHGALFFIHACGQQRGNLRLMDSLGVDGLEGVAFPPLGDVELAEAFRMTSDRFLITGGISAMETRDLTSRAEVFGYVHRLLDTLQPYHHRFILSASCNTATDAPWETLVHFRDAWREWGDG